MSVNNVMCVISCRKSRKEEYLNDVHFEKVRAEKEKQKAAERAKRQREREVLGKYEDWLEKKVRLWIQKVGPKN